MSQDKNDLPKTGRQDTGHVHSKPHQGETFVRDAQGAVKLTQTQKTFGGKG